MDCSAPRTSWLYIFQQSDKTQRRLTFRFVSQMHWHHNQNSRMKVCLLFCRQQSRKFFYFHPSSALLCRFRKKDKKTHLKILIHLWARVRDKLNIYYGKYVHSGALERGATTRIKPRHKTRPKKWKILNLTERKSLERRNQIWNVGNIRLSIGEFFARNGKAAKTTFLPSSWLGCQLQLKLPQSRTHNFRVIKVDVRR